MCDMRAMSCTRALHPMRSTAGRAFALAGPARTLRSNAPILAVESDTDTAAVLHEYGRLAAEDGPATPNQVGHMHYSEADRKLGSKTGADMGLGCGNPIALAQMAAGETVVDLGSGAGYDCLLAAKEVGSAGTVIGVDAAPKMIERATEAAKKTEITNVEYRLGPIEALPVADGIADVVISNCVINLSQNKPAVCREAFRVLRPGGRLAVSDVVRMQEELPARLLTRKGAFRRRGWRGDREPDGASSEPKDLAAHLKAAGFQQVEVALRRESAAFIKDWMPGSGAEKFVTAAHVTAVKPR